MISGSVRLFRIRWLYIIKYGLLFGGSSVFILVLEFNYRLETIDPQWAFFWVALLFSVVGVWAGSKISKPGDFSEQVLMNDAFEEAAADKPQIWNHQCASPEKLSDREFEVLVAMASGKSNQEIAEDLYIAISTVKTHVTRILQKTDAKRRTQAIQHAKKMGWIQ